MLDSTKFVKWFKKHDNIAGYVFFLFLSLCLAIIYYALIVDARITKDKIIHLQSDLESKNNSIDFYKKELNNNWKRFDDIYIKYIQEYELEKKELINNLNSHMKDKDFYDSLKIISLSIWLLSCLFYLIIRPFVINSLDKTKNFKLLQKYLLSEQIKQNKFYSEKTSKFFYFHNPLQKESKYENITCFKDLDSIWIHIQEDSLIFEYINFNYFTMSFTKTKEFSWELNSLKTITQSIDNKITTIYFENNFGQIINCSTINPLTEQELYDYSKLLMKHE